MKRFIKFSPYLKPYIKSIATLFCLILITILINLPIPLLQKKIIDDALPKGDIDQLYRLVVVIVLLYALYHSLSFIRNYLSIRVRQKVLTRVRMDMYEHLQKMSLQYFSKEQTGSLLSRMVNDVSYIQNLVNDEFFVVISSFIKVIIVIVLLFNISIKMTLMCAGVLPFIILIFFLFKNRVYTDNKRMQETQAELSGKIQENLSAMQLIQAETIETYKGEQTLHYSKELERMSIRRGMTGITGNFFITMISYLPLSAILWGAGGYLVIRGELTLGSLLAYMQYLFGLIGPITGFFRFNMNLQAGYAALDRIYGILDTPPQVRDEEGAVALTKAIHSITFRNVSLAFADRGDPKKTSRILNAVTLDIHRGEKIGIVGTSGGGKTSLVNLLLRFHTPSGGELLLNNQRIDTFTLKSIRERIAYVPQDVFLFNDTIKNNLCLGREYRAAEIESALLRSHSKSFVTAMKRGLDSVIGERGVTLSGGQRQRLCLARALLKKPDVFIFDEAFSALDSESDAVIQEMLKDSIKDATAIIIAHRFSFLELVDRILVVSEGRVVEDGSFAVLMKKEGLFYTLYKAQDLGDPKYSFTA